MKTILVPLLTTLVDLLRSRSSLHLEMLALRQQLAMVANRDNKRHRFRPIERIFWVWLYRLWPSCLQTLAIFKPDTVVRWYRQDTSCIGPGNLADTTAADQLSIPMCAN